MNWLKKLMAGRYGGDQLSIVLLVVSIVLTLIGRVTKISYIILISYIPLAISIVRMFSKDIPKRSLENYKFSIFISPVYSRYKKIQSSIGDRKTHKHYKCPNCKTSLRVPKGKGKINITCPKCKTKFEKRT